MIDTEGLTRKFGDVTAVDGLSIHVKEGEVFGLLGPNGAGKTTTVRILCCLIGKTGGEARIAGLDTADEADSLKIRQMIGLLPENVGLYDDLSVWQNLDFYAKLYGLGAREREESIGRFLGMLDLREKRDRPAGTLSKGMKQKVAIARALVHDPGVVFLDEPTANLDPEAAKTVRDFILELKKEKRTIFLNTHNLDEAQKLCDRIGILKTHLLRIGTPEELRGSLWGSRTVIQLAEVTGSIVAAVQQQAQNRVVVEDRRLVIDVTDPERENPDLVQAVVGAGGRIQFVRELAPTLEDVYLQIVRENS
ncbi:MAG TPA: ABC transporter ATP-binding protein [Methanomicrobiales archaeon]|nr:ABC transporter ATP-binding protein [Methanomicrobiales archaeon]